MSERLVWTLVFSFIATSMIFTVASLLSPEFRDNGYAIAGVIIGGYVSLIGGGFVGKIISKDIRKNGDEGGQSNGGGRDE